uniref:Uncharacterized protein n=1 Tax=Cucumis melo TaxID=3656 RepID=A0A9I9DJR0_CUCME
MVESHCWWSLGQRHVQQISNLQSHVWLMRSHKR